jgi:hypothetical protein
LKTLEWPPPLRATFTLSVFTGVALLSEGAARAEASDATEHVDRERTAAQGRIVADVEASRLTLAGELDKTLAGPVFLGGLFVRFRNARIGGAVAGGMLDGSSGGHPHLVPYLSFAASGEVIPPEWLDRLHLGVTLGEHVAYAPVARSWSDRSGREVLRARSLGTYARVDLVRTGPLDVYARVGSDIYSGSLVGALHENDVAWGARLALGASWTF